MKKKCKKKTEKKIEKNDKKIATKPTLEPQTLCLEAFVANRCAPGAADDMVLSRQFKVVAAPGEYNKIIIYIAVNS